MSEQQAHAIAGHHPAASPDPQEGPKGSHGEARTSKSFRLERATLEQIGAYRERHALASDALAIEHAFARGLQGAPATVPVIARIRFSTAARRQHFSHTAEIVPELLDLPVAFATLSASSREHLFDQLSPELGWHDLTRVRYVEPGGFLLSAEEYLLAVELEPYPETPEEWEELIQHHLKQTHRFEKDTRHRLKGEAEELFMRARSLLDAGVAVTEPLAEIVPGFEAPGILERYCPGLSELARRYHSAHLAYLEGHKTAQQQEEQRQLRDRAQWIEAHGSEYLRVALQHGYPCEDRYLKERLAQEHPGFELLDPGSIRLFEVSSPSEAALAKALQHGGRVMRAELNAGLLARASGAEVIVVTHWLCRHTIAWSPTPLPVSIPIQSTLSEDSSLPRW